MRKVLLALVVMALMVGMVSCSMDEYAKLGDMMGKMGNNVYGISANMTQVDNASNKMSESVKKEGGVVTVDLDKAAEIIDDIASIKNSAQKTEALKEQMQQPACSDEDAAELKAALDSKMSDLTSQLNALPAPSDPELQEIIDSVADTLANIQSNISEKPTKADLAAVAIINQLADTAKAAPTMDLGNTEALLETADKAFAAIDALKVVSEVSNVDLIGDLDLASLIASKGLAKDGEDDDSSKIFLPTVEKVVGLISKAGAFDSNKYNSFILQSKAIAASYDTAAWALNPYAFVKDGTNWFTNLDGLLDAGFKKGKEMSINDLTLYMVSFAFSTLDDLSKNDDALRAAYIQALTEFCAQFADMKKEGKLNWDSFSSLGEVFDASLATGKTYEDYDDLIDALLPKFAKAANTMGVILIQSDFQGIAGMLKSTIGEQSVGEYLTKTIDDALKEFKTSN